jgi:hypothetical protein
MFSLGYLGQFSWGKWLQATIQTLSKSSFQYMCGEKNSTLHLNVFRHGHKTYWDQNNCQWVGCYDKL